VGVVRQYSEDKNCTDQYRNGSQYASNRSESVNAEENIQQYEKLVVLRPSLE